MTGYHCKKYNWIDLNMNWNWKSVFDSTCLAYIILQNSWWICWKKGRINKESFSSKLFLDQLWVESLLMSSGPFKHYVTLFWLILDPLPPKCDFWGYFHEPCDVTFFNEQKTLSFLRLLWYIFIQKWPKIVTRHSGCHSAILSRTPVWMSRIIWMKRPTHHIHVFLVMSERDSIMNILLSMIDYIHKVQE